MARENADTVFEFAAELRGQFQRVQGFAIVGAARAEQRVVTSAIGAAIPLGAAEERFDRDVCPGSGH
jgi:hypothetical protein